RYQHKCVRLPLLRARRPRKQEWAAAFKHRTVFLGRYKCFLGDGEAISRHRTSADLVPRDAVDVCGFIIPLDGPYRYHLLRERSVHTGKIQEAGDVCITDHVKTRSVILSRPRIERDDSIGLELSGRILP